MCIWTKIGIRSVSYTHLDLAMKIILDVLETTGITATAGIGTNLFLCKVAMDIVAKHIPADEKMCIRDRS